MSREQCPARPPFLSSTRRHPSLHSSPRVVAPPALHSPPRRHEHRRGISATTFYSPDGGNPHRVLLRLGQRGSGGAASPGSSTTGSGPRPGASGSTTERLRDLGEQRPPGPTRASSSPPLARAPSLRTSSSTVGRLPDHGEQRATAHRAGPRGGERPTGEAAHHRCAAGRCEEMACRAQVVIPLGPSLRCPPYPAFESPFKLEHP
ncbi:hypothetical protein C2845_PM05G03440 [Panicum miliaceum]|uniref:Uncharacterized protein n=1 Tax=Panicum miliaceum TaxID=4540 RepID=A0A3L6T5Y8_PANMI|nr:hypothetical protein C2845_PM05G03440 [Panicum miliaceum]